MRERLWLTLLLGGFVAVNLVTASRSPTVWQDEVMFADPAVNLVKHGKWVSTAWPCQSANEVWIGNAPLYPALLAMWLKAFGTDITAVRSLNYLLTALTALTLWSWSCRSKTVTQPWARLLMVVLILCGQGVAFSYRSGRYDALGYLLVSVGLWAFTLDDARIRYSLSAGVGFLLPWTGLQLLPLVTAAGALSLLAFERRFVMVWLWLALGTVTGGCVLGGILKVLGLWQPFCASVMGLSGSNTPVVAKLKGFGSIYVQDQSFVAILVAVAVLLFSQWRTITGFTHRVVVVACGSAILLPALLYFMAKFPIYYGWMCFMPLAVVVAHLLSYVDTQLNLTRKIALLGLVVTILVGLPARLAVTVVQWKERDYGPVRALADRTIRKADVVYADEQGYYAVKAVATGIFLPFYRPVMSISEQRQITCLFINPRNFANVTSWLVGKWTDTGEFVAPEPGGRSVGAAKYDLHVWRRASN